MIFEWLALKEESGREEVVLQGQIILLVINALNIDRGRTTRLFNPDLPFSFLTDAS